MEVTDLPLECLQLILENITHKPTIYGPLHMFACVVEGAVARVTPWLPHLLLSASKFLTCLSGCCVASQAPNL